MILSLAAALVGIESVSAILLHYSRLPLPLPADLEGGIIDGQFPQTEYDPYLQFRLRPGVKTEHYWTNSRGLRGPEFVPLQGQLKVLLLGGSVAWSYLARSDQETLAARLNRFLSDQLEFGRFGWNSVVVLNAGVPASVARQSAIAYARTWRELEPQIVISLDGVNDVSAAIRNGVGQPLFENPFAYRFERRREALKNSFPRWLAERFERSKFNRYRRILNPLPREPSAAPEPSEIARSYADAIGYLATLTTVDGALLIPVLQPVCALQGSKHLNAFEKELARLHEREMPGLNRYFNAVYAELRRGLGSIAGKYESVFPLDASGAFQSEDGTCFADCYHLGPRGIELLAGTIGREVVRAVEKRQGPR